jgi:hypothetical protein
MKFAVTCGGFDGSPDQECIVEALNEREAIRKVWPEFRCVVGIRPYLRRDTTTWSGPDGWVEVCEVEV